MPLFETHRDIGHPDHPGYLGILEWRNWKLHWKIDQSFYEMAQVITHTRAPWSDLAATIAALFQDEMSLRLSSSEKRYLNGVFSVWLIDG